MAVAVSTKWNDQSDEMIDTGLRQALVQLGPSWLARDPRPFQEVIVAPLPELAQHIISRWPDTVGPAESLVTITRHIEAQVGPLALPKARQHIGVILADGAAAAFSEQPPLIGYDLRKGRLLAQDENWDGGNLAHLLVGAAALDQDEIDTYLRMKAKEAEAPLAEQALNELMQWQKELAAMKASLQASLMQGVDPMALGDILQALNGLMAQSAVLRSVTVLAKKQPNDIRHHIEVRKQASAIQGMMEKLVSSGKLPTTVSMKMLSMLNRLTRTMSGKPSVAQAGILKVIQAKMALRKDVMRMPVIHSVIAPSTTPKARVGLSFRQAATATALRFPVSLQVQQRFAGLAARSNSPKAANASLSANKTALGLSSPRMQLSAVQKTDGPAGGGAFSTVQSFTRNASTADAPVREAALVALGNTTPARETASQASLIVQAQPSPAEQPQVNPAIVEVKITTVETPIAKVETPSVRPSEPPSPPYNPVTGEAPIVKTGPQSVQPPQPAAPPPQPSAVRPEVTPAPTQLNQNPPPPEAKQPHIEKAPDIQQPAPEKPETPSQPAQPDILDDMKKAWPGEPQATPTDRNEPPKPSSDPFRNLEGEYTDIKVTPKSDGESPIVVTGSGKMEKAEIVAADDLLNELDNHLELNPDPPVCKDTGRAACSCLTPH